MLVLFTGIASASIMFILLRSESGSEHDDDDDDVLKQSAHGKPLPDEGNYADSDGFIHIRSLVYL